MRRDDGLDDNFIVDQVVDGKTELFNILVERHQRAVYGLGLSFFRNSEDSADFTQEVFLKAYRNLPEFKGHSRFGTWLYRIAYNTAINGIKRRKEYQCLAEDAEIPDTDSPERKALRSAIRDAIGQAVKELPERYRVCVDLYFFYDRTYREIEAVTEIPVNTIKSHVFRAKKLLRTRLGAYMEGGIE